MGPLSLPSQIKQQVVVTAARDTKPWGMRKCAVSQVLPGLSHSEPSFPSPCSTWAQGCLTPRPPQPTTLSTAPSINQVPRDPWLARLCLIHRTQESTSPDCRHSGHCCLEGARRTHTPSCGTAISWVRMRLLGEGLLGRGAQTPELGHGWRSREDSQSPTQDRTTCSPAPPPPPSPVWLPLPRGCFPPTTLPRLLT